MVSTVLKRTGPATVAATSLATLAALAALAAEETWGLGSIWVAGARAEAIGAGDVEGDGGWDRVHARRECSGVSVDVEWAKVAL